MPDQELDRLPAAEGAHDIISARVLNEGTIIEARRRVEIMDKLKAVAISHTRPSNWTNFGDTPYLDEKGCMVFAQDFGVSFAGIHVEQVAYTDERGPVLDFIATLTATWLGRSIECDGGRSTKDKFFNGTNDDGTVKRMPLSEIKVIDVRKAAVTNAKARATKAILALSFTKEEVQAALKAGGRDASKVGDVKFDKGSKGGKAGATAVDPSVAEKRAKLHEAILRYTEGDEEQAQRIIWALSKFQDKDGKERGATDISKMSDKWVIATYAKAEKDEEIGPYLRPTEAPDSGSEGGEA